ncbi:MAG: RimK family alpha-L-glutamate ligase [Marinifilaceae bacterium]
MMKIAIHDRPGSFSDAWIEYCKRNNFPFKIVNAYSSDIIDQLYDCNILMWHHHHGNYRDTLFAKQLLYSLQISGKKVFPDFNTGWHFDDKVGQKYMLEAIGAPLVSSYVFYDKKEALDWVKKTSFPKVFKLRGGAGAANVKLLRSKSDARYVINKSFGRGISQFNKWNNLKEKWIRYRRGRDGFLEVLKGIGRIFINTEFGKMRSPEKGYVYFQDFIPGRKVDYRLQFVGKRCWAMIRKVRENDFRASGSDNMIFDKNQIPNQMLDIAYDIVDKLSLQSAAFDFLIDDNSNILLIEISYGFGVDKEIREGEIFVDEFAHGYWDENKLWHDEVFDPQVWMIQNIINQN